MTLAFCSSLSSNGVCAIQVVHGRFHGYLRESGGGICPHFLHLDRFVLPHGILKSLPYGFCDVIL